MDIGGFSVESRFTKPNEEDLAEWREMNARWFQFGAFCPVFRSHGQYPYREIYNISPEGHEVYKTMVDYTNLRYRLMPYIYSIAGKTFHNDYTIMRGLIMDFPHDAKVKDIGDQYMYGSSLLINPVYEYKSRKRNLYLPKGQSWYELHSGKLVEGGQQITADAPLERMPVYIKAGSIIPTGPALQYTGEKNADVLRVFVYAGANGSFELYEDEGVNYNYEKDKFSIIPMKYDDASNTLTIGERQGVFEGMITKRKIEIVWVNNNKPVGMDFSVAPDQVVEYSGKAISATLK
jgi:alpha-D-xyloside xylohydrolase